MGLAQKIVQEEEKLRAFDNDIKKSIGYIHLDMQIADTSVLQRFKVVKCQGSMTIVLGRDFLFKHYSTEFDWLNGQVRLGRNGYQGSMTIVLGRDFLFKHYSTEFDWLNGQVRLGRKWLKPKVWVRGGSFQDRVAVANSEKQEVVFDYPNLTSQQKSKLLTLPNGYSDCFASNQNKPTATTLGEDVIDTISGTRPVKAKGYRISPQQEEEINKQVDGMVENGVTRPSNSPWAHNVILVEKKDNTFCCGLSKIK